MDNLFNYISYMRLLKKIKLIWMFYCSFIFSSMLITFCCLALFWRNGFRSFAGIFWLKIITLALTFYFINSYKSKEFYYYQNLGISKNILWLTTLLFDFTLFLFLIFMIYSMK